MCAERVLSCQTVDEGFVLPPSGIDPPILGDDPAVVPDDGSQPKGPDMVSHVRVLIITLVHVAPSWPHAPQTNRSIFPNPLDRQAMRAAPRRWPAVVERRPPPAPYPASHLWPCAPIRRRQRSGDN